MEEQITEQPISRQGGKYYSTAIQTGYGNLKNKELILPGIRESFLEVTTVDQVLER
jgi:hypothetical protein